MGAHCWGYAMIPVSLKGESIAVYARFSSDNQKDTSIDDQIRLCTEYIAKGGGEVNPSFVLADHAISGAVRDRPAFERLRQLVNRGEIRVIVCESTDRLSRDLGDSDRLWKLIAYKSVRLICVSDGIDSLNETSRMHFRFKALFADEFLADLGKKTLRGLIGANERGTATGGVPYGYKTCAAAGDDDGERGRLIVIDEEQAQVVRRIFEMYRDGRSYLTIATTLNDEHVPPPRAKSKKRASRFWKKGTIREMLRNAAYAGTWMYCKKRWRKDPETRRRRPEKQAQDKVRVDERPHLRIIDPALWEVVRDRREAVRENYAGKGEGAAGHRTSHPLSGVLFCGVCGHRMVDGGGSSSRAYRCSAAATGGACSNKNRLREDVLLEAAITALKRVLFETSLREQIEEKIHARLATYVVKTNDERRRLERELARAEAEIGRLVSFVRTLDPTTNPGALSTISASIEETTNERRSIQAKLAALATAEAAPRVPSEAEIAAAVMDIERRLKFDPTTAREQIRRMLVSGKITMTPQPDGSWVADSALIVGRIGGPGAPRPRGRGARGNGRDPDDDDGSSPKTPKPRNREVSGASSEDLATGEVVEIGSCAGVQPDFPAQQIQRVAEVWVPFDEVISVGWK